MSVKYALPNGSLSTYYEFQKQKEWLIYHLVEPHVSFFEQDDKDIDELQVVPEHLHHILNMPRKAVL